MAADADGWLPLHVAGCSGKADAVHLLCTRMPSLPSFARNPRPWILHRFLLAPGRLPLPPTHWDLVPVPCPDIKLALAAALAHGVDQAAQIARRLQPAEKARLRAAALCLRRHGVPRDAAAPILARCL